MATTTTTMTTTMAMMAIAALTMNIINLIFSIIPVIMPDCHRQDDGQARRRSTVTLQAASRWSNQRGREGGRGR
eukprot:15436351-Alexandrium_andersonii.AAC.1